MKFGKFSVQQIIQNAACGLFCFEIKTKSEYGQLRQAAVKIDSELVKKWDVCVGKCGFPVYLTKAGQALSKLYAIQHDYYVVAFEDIEFSLPTDLNTYVCNELNKMQDHRKEQVYELVKKLAEEEAADEYWYLDSTGAICSARISSNPTEAKDRMNTGNSFTTQDEAYFELHRRLAVAKWKRIHHKLEQGRTLGGLMYFPCYDSLKNKVIVNCAEFMLFGQLVFSSAETCKRAIEDLGEMNVRDYILEVKP